MNREKEVRLVELMEQREELKLQDLMDEYERRYLELAPLQEELEAIKLGIKELVLGKGTSVSHRNVRAAITRAHVRVFWDSKGLDGYAVADEKILKFRSEREYKTSVRVTVKK